VAIHEYFHLRHAFEAQDWAALDKTKLDRFRDLRQRFTRNLDALYARWRSAETMSWPGDGPSGGH